MDSTRPLGPLFEGFDIAATAIKRIQAFEPPDGSGYYVANSFGKDSCVVMDLVKKSGVKFDAHHNLTTCDPPELIAFGKKHFPETIIDRPEKTMWELIASMRMPPTRIVRECCKVLKEPGGEERLVITGIRWGESGPRSARGMVEQCRTVPGKRYLHPIIDWSEDDVWWYIKSNNLPYCPLYDEGFTRLGCICCPFKSVEARLRDAERWPKFRAAYVRAFQRMVDKRIADGLETTWKDGEDVFRWWVR